MTDFRQDTHGLGARLRKLRERTGLRQVDVARKAGVSQGYLSLIEHGLRTPSRGIVGKLADAYRVDPLELVW